MRKPLILGHNIYMLNNDTPSLIKDIPAYCYFRRVTFLNFVLPTQFNVMLLFILDNVISFLPIMFSCIDVGYAILDRFNVFYFF